MSGTIYFADGYACRFQRPDEVGANANCTDPDAWTEKFRAVGIRAEVDGDATKTLRLHVYLTAQEVVHHEALVLAYLDGAVAGWGKPYSRARGRHTPNV